MARKKRRRPWQVKRDKAFSELGPRPCVVAALEPHSFYHLDQMELIRPSRAALMHLQQNGELMDSLIVTTQAVPTWASGPAIMWSTYDINTWGEEAMDSVEAAKAVARWILKVKGKRNKLYVDGVDADDTARWLNRWLSVDALGVLPEDKPEQFVIGRRKGNWPLEDIMEPGIGALGVCLAVQERIASGQRNGIPGWRQLRTDHDGR